MNTWPNGKRRVLTQSEHEKWNAHNYPGTRQLCSQCGEPTGRCEEDSSTDGDGNPFCADCHKTGAREMTYQQALESLADQFPNHRIRFSFSGSRGTIRLEPLVCSIAGYERGFYFSTFDEVIKNIKDDIAKSEQDD